MPETPTPTPPAPPPPQPRRKLVNLLLVWRYASRYPLQFVAALISLVVSSVATLLIPRTFPTLIANGFSADAAQPRLPPFFPLFFCFFLPLALPSPAGFFFVSFLF